MASYEFKVIPLLGRLEKVWEKKLDAVGEEGFHMVQIVNTPGGPVAYMQREKALGAVDLSTS